MGWRVGGVIGIVARISATGAISWVKAEIGMTRRGDGMGHGFLR